MAEAPDLALRLVPEEGLEPPDTPIMIPLLIGSIEPKRRLGEQEDTSASSSPRWRATPAFALD
jgi:hypothetical protein